MRQSHWVRRALMAVRLSVLCTLIAPAACTPASTTEEKLSPSKQVIQLPGGVVVDQGAREVRVPAVVAIDVGWLEQVVCTQGTREHESLLMVDVPPSEVHAALMLIGLEPGRPGAWVFEEDESGNPRLRRIAPEGDLVEVRVAHRNQEGVLVEESVAEWIVGAGGEEAFPESSWVFGGSLFRRGRSEQGAVETYLADESGSLVGLVTFGDEVLGLDIVLSDQVGIDAAEWQAKTGAMPVPGTPAELILRPWPEPLDSP